MTAALLNLRISTSDLKSRGIVPSSTLGILEAEIGWALMSFQKIDEARDLFKQAVSDLKQSLAKNPEDKEARLHPRRCPIASPAAWPIEAGQFEDALNCFEQQPPSIALEPGDSNLLVLQFSIRDCEISPIDLERVVERVRRNVRDD